MKEVGIKSIIRINSIGHTDCRGAYKKDLVAYYRKKINYLCKDCKRRLKENPLRLLDCKEEKCREFRAGAPQMIDYLCDDCKTHFKEVLEFLDENSIPYIMDNYLVRGLDYYSRTVFEGFLDDDKIGAGEEETKEETEDLKGEKQKNGGEEEKKSLELALGGGGRYDYLSKAFSSKSVPAVGFAMGVDRITSLLREKGVRVKKEKAPKVFLIQLGIAAKRKSLSVMEIFRDAKIPVSQSLSKDGIQTQLKIADRMGVGYALILGQKEALDGTIMMRDMSSGSQETVPMDKIIDYIRKKLK